MEKKSNCTINEVEHAIAAIRNGTEPVPVPQPVERVCDRCGTEFFGAICPACNYCMACGG